MNEVYTLHELAQELGVSWQNVVSWRRRDMLPTKAINADGSFSKAMMDPFIEDYKNGILPEAQEKKPKKVKKAKKTQPVAQNAPAKKSKASPEDFDEFTRRFWQKGNRAVDVLLMPQETAAKVREYVNEALQFAFDAQK